MVKFKKDNFFRCVKGQDVDYDRFCKRCQHYDFDLRKGILCGLTEEKPSFVDTCEKFELDPQKDKTSTRNTKRRLSFPSEKPLPELNESLRKWGIGLIILGMVHLVLSNFLDPLWGSIIIILGILNLFIKKRGMFIANGSALLLVGIMNILGTTLPEGGGFGWLIFGLLQLVWGIQEIRKFKLYSDDAITSSNEINNNAQQLGTINLNQDKSRHSGLGIASFILSIVAFFTQIFVYTVYTIKQFSDPQWLEQESIGSTLIGFLMIVSIFIVLVGFGLGIAGIIQKEKRKVFSVLGVVLNLLMIMFLGFAMIPG